MAGRIRNLCRQALCVTPDHTSALYNLRLVLPSRAARPMPGGLRRLLRAVLPTFAPGTVAWPRSSRRKTGRPKPRPPIGRRSGTTRPTPRPYHGLGNVLRDEGRLPDAKACYDRSPWPARGAGD